MTHATPGTDSLPLVIGLDLGTSSCKACLTDGDGKPLATVNVAYPTHTPKPGWSEQHPADWIDALCHAMDQLYQTCSNQLHRIKAIGLTSAAHIGVLLDETDHVIRPAILWNDQRSAVEADILRLSHGAQILARTCQDVSSSWTLSHLAWVKKHEPQHWKNVQQVLLSKDYLAYLLTGRKVTDPATAVSTQLYDVTFNCWSESLCDLLELECPCLPHVESAFAIIGTITRQWAERLHLPHDVVVVNGSLDSATELLAAGCMQSGQGMIRLATAGGLQIVVDQALPSTTRITYPHLHHPNWYVQAGTNCCGGAVQWGMSRFCQGMSHQQVQYLAQEAPACCDGLLFHPFLAGERAPYWNPKLRGGFTRLNLSHQTSHMIRAIFEGTAMSIRDAMRTLSDIQLSDSPLAVIGGGSLNRLWVQILANVLNRPLQIMPHADSSFGAAMIAIQAISGTTDSFTQHVHPTDCITPDADLARRYEDHFQVYSQLAIMLNESCI